MFFALLASLLLASPAPTPLDGFALVLPVQREAVRWQILDPRECTYVLTRPGELQTDLAMLRARFQHFHHAPRLEECERFPPRALGNDLCQFNRSYWHRLDDQRDVDRLHAGELTAAMEETDRLYAVWDAVRDAGAGYYYITVRRDALLDLREKIGSSAFYAGKLPPHVPLWRFPERD